jgi:5-methylcytosine-specific restriction enzyme subunit McrC
MLIPVENIYYLLCYAWNKLEEKDRVAVSVDDKIELLDLFAKIIINACKLLFKRGVDHDYVINSLELPGVKGKLEFSQTLKSNLLSKQKTFCTFDEFSLDILPNQILVSTLYGLIRIKGLDPLHKKELKQLIWMFTGIEPIELNSAIFKQVRLNRNNRFYGFVLNVCEIIFDNSLPTEEKGVYQFADFTRDDQKMNQLFEAFIRNFYRIELAHNHKVKSEIIKWQFEYSENESYDYLPQMQTDITIENDKEKIIIDTKFYKETMVSNYNKDRIKSANLYQLFSYLLNQETQEAKTTHATGILLYPTIEQDYNLSFKYNDHPIYIKTVNLNTNWRNIEKRLKEIIK